MHKEPVVFHAVGDIALGDHPLCTGFGTHSRCGSRHPGFAFERVATTLRDADIVFGNLECTLSNAGLRPRHYHSVQMRGHPAYATGLRSSGFTVLNLANNHSMQHGEQPFIDTVQLLRANGIAVCGANAGDIRRAEPAVISRNGFDTTFLGYSLRPRQYFTKEPLYAEGFHEELLDDVRRARAFSHSVIVSLHWGSEFIERPSPGERDIAHQIIDAGADLIIGHHPHVLRGIERYGRGYIVYSLGNFVCDMIWDDTLRDTAIVRCELTAAGIAGLRLIPVRINDDYQPVVVDDKRCLDIIRRVNRLSNDLHDTSGSPTLHETTEHYALAADQAQVRIRKESHRYFLRNAYRFQPRIVFQQLWTYICNRLAERGLIRTPDTVSNC